MLYDARELEDGAVLECDLAIVGAGAAGITIARALIGSGLEVRLFESGGREYEQEVQDLYSGEIIGLPYFDLDVARLRFFGGTTNHWAGRCRPLDAIDFEARPWVPYSGWPIGLADLDPYYLRAQEICQLGPPVYDATAWLGPGEAALPFGSFRSLVWQYSPPTRFGEVYGPELDRADNVALWMHASALEVETDSFGRQVTGVRFGTLAGKRFACRARCVVLACGGLETPRLLLVSTRAAPNGLGNGHGLVGRFFMEHPHLVAARVLVADPAILDFYNHDLRGTVRGAVEVVGCLALEPERQRREELLNYDTNFAPDNIGDSGYAALRRIWNSLERGEYPEAFMADLRAALLDVDDTFAGLLNRFGVREYASAEGAFRVWSFSEQVPNPESRVLLADDRDPLGLPRIKLDWRLTAQDQRSLLRTLEIMGQEFGRTGIGRVQIEDWLREGSPTWSPELEGGFHHMGTTRMADDPTRGVVDRNCRVHGTANLYVAGSSVFATAGAANPTLTIVALALRLAEHLKRELTG